MMEGEDIITHSTPYQSGNRRQIALRNPVFQTPDEGTPLRGPWRFIQNVSRQYDDSQDGSFTDHSISSLARSSEPCSHNTPRGRENMFRTPLRGPWRFLQNVSRQYDDSQDGSFTDHRISSLARSSELCSHNTPRWRPAHAAPPPRNRQRVKDYFKCGQGTPVLVSPSKHAGQPLRVLPDNNDKGLDYEIAHRQLIRHKITVTQSDTPQAERAQMIRHGQPLPSPPPFRISVPKDFSHDSDSEAEMRDEYWKEIKGRREEEGRRAVRHHLEKDHLGSRMIEDDSINERDLARNCRGLTEKLKRSHSQGNVTNRGNSSISRFDRSARSPEITIHDQNLSQADHEIFYDYWNREDSFQHKSGREKCSRRKSGSPLNNDRMASPELSGVEDSGEQFHHSNHRQGDEYETETAKIISRNHQRKEHYAKKLPFISKPDPRLKTKTMKEVGERNADNPLQFNCYKLVLVNDDPRTSAGSSDVNNVDMLSSVEKNVEKYHREQQKRNKLSKNVHIHSRNVHGPKRKTGKELDGQFGRKKAVEGYELTSEELSSVEDDDGQPQNTNPRCNNENVAKTHEKTSTEHQKADYHNNKLRAISKPCPKLEKKTQKKVGRNGVDDPRQVHRYHKKSLANEDDPLKASCAKKGPQKSKDLMTDPEQIFVSKQVKVVLNRLSPSSYQDDIQIEKVIKSPEITKTKNQEEPVFKIPSLPKVSVIPKGAKRLLNWAPLNKGGKLRFRGNIANIFDEYYRTSAVIEVINPHVIRTKTSVSVLEGEMGLSVAEEHDVPSFIIQSFRSGVPENWEILLKKWTSIKAAAKAERKKRKKKRGLASDSISTTVSSLDASSNTSSTVRLRPRPQKVSYSKPSESVGLKTIKRKLSRSEEDTSSEPGEKPKKSSQRDVRRK